MAPPNLSLIFTDEEKAILRQEGFELQPTADLRRWNQLAIAYRASKLWDENGFCCSMVEGCYKAFRHDNPRLSIQSNHKGTVGDYLAAYDLLYKGNPLRVCVVSIDSGSSTTSFEDRTEEAGHLLSCQFPRKWRHWICTVKLMNHLFFGKYPMIASKAILPRKLFTHIRAIKCNAGRDWNQPQVMYKNCLKHLEVEIDVLEPTLIIGQGFRTSLDSYGRRCFSEHIPSTNWALLQTLRKSCKSEEDCYEELLGHPVVDDETMIARRFIMPWGVCVLLGSSHPTDFGRYNKALKNDLKPAINTIMGRERSYEG